jgi:hypothetical protein
MQLPGRQFAGVDSNVISNLKTASVCLDTCTHFRGRTRSFTYLRGDFRGDFRGRAGTLPFSTYCRD